MTSGVYIYRQVH